MVDKKIRFILWVLLLLLGCFVIVSGERKFVKIQVPSFNVTSMIQEQEHSFLRKAVNFLWKSNGSGYTHVWPVSCLMLFLS